MKIFKVRRAESLIEFLTSLTVFGIIMSGLCEFISSEYRHIASMKARDELFFYAQCYLNDKDFTSGDISIRRDENFLTVKKGKHEIKFLMTK